MLDDRDTIDRYLEELGYLEQDAGASMHPPEVLLPDGADGLMAVALLKTAAREVGRFPDRARFRAAFAAVAHGLGDLAAAFAYGKPRTGAFKPGEAFGPNLQALVHYLVQAVDAGASGEDVDAAIRDALLVFPYKLQDDQLGWGDLGWLGRIRFHQLGAAPLGEVADRMFDYVRTL